MAKALCSLQLAKGSSRAEGFVWHRQPQLGSPQAPMGEVVLRNGTRNGDRKWEYGNQTEHIEIALGERIWNGD